MDHLQRALDEDPANALTHLYLGLAHRDMGDYQLASREIQSYKALMIGFVQAIYNQGGWDAVIQVYSDLPQSTEQILHPERYHDKDAPVPVDIPDLAEFLGEGWQEVNRNVRGEYGLRLIPAAYFGQLGAEQAAEGWGGDEYVLLEKSAIGPDLERLETILHDYCHCSGKMTP